MPAPVFRFAPSPTGRLHLGHALSALLNADMALDAGGRLLLRIEDTDLSRARAEHEAAIRSDLARLGLVIDGPVRRQSEHFDAYRDALQRLAAMGLLYPSPESRGAVAAHVAAWEAREGRPWPRDPDGAPLNPIGPRAEPVSGLEEHAAAGWPVALRLDMRAALARLGIPLRYLAIDRAMITVTEIPVDPRRWGDPVLARKGAPTSYHLAVVVDDALQGVTHVVRGEDIEPATAIHRVLQELLGLPAPLYHHHRLILGADGRKLSKSEGAASLAALFDQGRTTADIRALVGL